MSTLTPTDKAKKARAIGIMAPHAGLIFSGPVAGMVYSAIEPPESFVLLGPNHTGLGAKIAIMPEGTWEIPTGSVEIDSALADSIIDRAPEVSEDSEAHMQEHSLEVQLPFIVHNAPGAKIVPIAMLGVSLEGYHISYVLNPPRSVVSAGIGEIADGGRGASVDIELGAIVIAESPLYWEVRW